MTSKLRRPPLFTYSDGSICLSSYPQYATCKNKQPYPMECGVSATYPSTNGGAPNGIMTDVRSERSPAKSGLHVNFSEKGEVKERREKFLTAKYGSHQMSLIRKRLAVEMWLYDELQKLYEPSENPKTREVEVDIDELLDMDSDDQRRRHLQELLADAKKSQHDVKKFVDDLLERAKTL